MGIDDVERRFERMTEVELLGPVHTRLLLSYGDLAPDYGFYGSATPLDDDHSMYVRCSALAAPESDQPYEMFHAYSRRITLEDKVVLETTHGDFSLDTTAEVHLRCDRTTLEYRRHLARLVTSPGASAPGVDARGAEAGLAGGGAPDDSLMVG